MEPELGTAAETRRQERKKKEEEEIFRRRPEYFSPKSRLYSCFRVILLLLPLLSSSRVRYGRKHPPSHTTQYKEERKEMEVGSLPLEKKQRAKGPPPPPRLTSLTHHRSMILLLLWTQ